MAEDKGTPAMIRIWTAIKDGADAYLTSQLKTILPFVAILVFALFASAWIAPPTPAAHEDVRRQCPDHHRVRPGWGVSSWARPSR